MQITTVNGNFQVLAPNAAPNGYLMQNTSPHPIFVDSGRPASNDGSSILLEPGSAVDSTLPGFSVTQALNVFSPVAGGSVAIKY